MEEKTLKQSFLPILLLLLQENGLWVWLPCLIPMWWPRDRSLIVYVCGTWIQATVRRTENSWNLLQLCLWYVFSLFLLWWWWWWWAMMNDDERWIIFIVIDRMVLLTPFRSPIPVNSWWWEWDRNTEWADGGDWREWRMEFTSRSLILIYLFNTFMNHLRIDCLLQTGKEKEVKEVS